MPKQKQTPSIDSLTDGTYTFRDLQKIGFTRREIQKLLKSGDIIRSHRGLYSRSDIDLDPAHQFQLATQRIGKPSAICLLSALSFYNLTDVIPQEVWILAPLEKRTKFKDLRIYRSRNPRWKTEILKEEGFSITSLERSLVESLLHPKLKFPIATQAIRLALQKKKTTLHKLYETASRLGLKDRIYKKLEVLL